LPVISSGCRLAVGAAAAVAAGFGEADVCGDCVALVLFGCVVQAIATSAAAASVIANCVRRSWRFISGFLPSFNYREG
jgi:hypothetical protein